jgi:hypothetical protein
MKNALPVFLILIVCNISFSQEKRTKLFLENELKNDTEIAVFKCHPNPVEDELFIIGTYNIKRIEIIDASGKSVAVYEFNKSIIRLNVSDLKTGIYLLKAIDEHDKVEVKQLVVK